jgi:Ca2+-binding EF-hand superfamily protein
MMLDASIKAVTQSSKDYARAIGLSAAAVTGYSKAIDISLRGLSAADQEKAIAAALGGFGDDIAKVILGDLGQALLRQGETASTGLARLATSLTSLNAVLGSLGQTLLQASLQNADAAQQLLDAFGGLSNYAQSANQYLEAYYSAAERTTLATKSLSTAFGALGLQLPDTLAGFRALVEAQDLTTTSGREAYATLLKLAPAFKEVTDSLAQQVQELADTVARQMQDLQSKVAAAQSNLTAAQNEARSVAQAILSERDGIYRTILGLQGKQVQIDGMDLAKVDPVNRGLAAFAQALQRGKESAAALAQAQTAAAQAAQEAAARQQTAAGGVLNYVRGLMSGTAQTARPEDAYRADLAAAQRGDVAALERLPTSAGAFADFINQRSSNATQRDMGLSRLADELSALPAVKSWAQRQVEATLALEQTLKDANAAAIAAQAEYFDALGKSLASGFGSIDLNTDGLLTFDELRTGLKGLATDDQIGNLITRVDANGDGMVSKSEAVRASIESLGSLSKSYYQQLLASFAGFDSNLNGLLTFDELKTGLGALATDDQIRALIARVDANGDGLVAKQELTVAALQGLSTTSTSYYQQLLASFAGFDSNLNGLLTFDELRTGLNGLATDDQIRALIARVDANGDGFLAQQELTNAALKDVATQTAKTVQALANGFDTLDLNFNGLLSAEELKAGLAGLASDDQIRELIKATDLNGDGQISKQEAIRKAAEGTAENVLDGTSSQVAELRSLAGSLTFNSDKLVELKGAIISLQNEVKLSNAQATLLAASAQQKTTFDKAGALIESIFSLADQAGVTLSNSKGSTNRNDIFWTRPDGLLVSDVAGIKGSSSNPDGYAKFVDQWRGQFGLDSKFNLLASDSLNIASQVMGLRSLIRSLGGIPAFAAGGMHTGGLRMVGELGPEVEATGPARLWSNAETRKMLGGDNSAVVAELRSVRQEIRDLRAETRATAQNTEKTARTLDRVTQGTDALIVQQVEATA